MYLILQRLLKLLLQVTTCNKETLNQTRKEQIKEASKNIFGLFGQHFPQITNPNPNSTMSFQSDDENHHNRRLYNPYQDLNIPSQPLYKLPTSPEFLFQEESIAQRRSWGENITYYTGIGYLTGAVYGAGKGSLEGVRAFESTDTTKLKINRILNKSGQHGRDIGNRAGVIGLMFAVFESGMVAARDKDDIVNSLVAGLGTGAVFQAAKGVRSAALGGAIGGVAVGLAVAGKQAFKRYVPI